MPPKRRNTAQEREGRLLLAIDALKKGQISNIYQASRIYRVNNDTLKCRMNGRACRAETFANGRNLDHNEEALLTEWILNLASHGFPPQKKPVGKKWFQPYIERTPEVQMAQSKKYDYQRAKQEDPEVIYEHFRLLKNVVNKHGIQNDDIYNMDEIGFQKGNIGSAKVVTACNSTKYHIQPGNRD
ncbi:putative Psq domain transposase [Zopfia rhizophila CBS 207.26]|uniref:Putative Psq domain transposase n=1 Tax=Zopfia rhizophila CBS 207.26 TaxID=1314779 RepID=A0A6A6ED33_9PEZI|nr:putative Psq domain transposase [Zopfia rhizophila CBS 207.26]